MDNGAKLAVEAINAAGGIKSLGGAKLELLSADTQGKPEVGQSEAQRLIQEGAVALVGTYQSAVSANVAAVAERNKVPFVIDVSSADAILAQGYQYTLPAPAQLHRDGRRGRRAVPRPRCPRPPASRPRRSPSCTSRARFGTAVKDVFRPRRRRARHARSAPAISYDPASVSDFTTQITAVKAAGADVLMVAGYYRDGVLVAKAVNTVKPGPQRRVRRGQRRVRPPAVPPRRPARPARASSTPTTTWTAKNPPDTRRWPRCTRTSTTTTIRTGAVLAYDAVRVIADRAGDRAKSADPTKLRGRDRADRPAVAARPARARSRSAPTARTRTPTPILMQVQGGEGRAGLPRGHRRGRVPSTRLSRGPVSQATMAGRRRSPPDARGAASPRRAAARWPLGRRSPRGRGRGRWPIVLAYVRVGQRRWSSCQAVVTGILVGGVYGLVAMGLTLIFGVLDIVNFAHGAFLALALYITFVGGQHARRAPATWRWSWRVPVMFLLGAAVQRGMLSGAIGQAAGEPAAHHAGHLALLIENAPAAVLRRRTRSRSSCPATRRRRSSAPSPTCLRLLAFGGALVLAGLLYLLLRRTRLGTAIRAVAANDAGAQLVGIDTRADLRGHLRDRHRLRRRRRRCSWPRW